MVEAQGEKRPEMPEGCIEGFDLHFLQKMLMKKERPHIEAVLAKIPQLNIFRVRSRHEMERVFSELVSKVNQSWD